MKVAELEKEIVELKKRMDDLEKAVKRDRIAFFYAICRVMGIDEEKTSKVVKIFEEGT